MSTFRQVSTTLLGLLFAVSVLAACGNGETATTSSTSVPSTSTTAPTVTTTTSPPTTTTPVSTTNANVTTITDLRGEPVEGGPPADAVLLVIGVAHDDVLNLRAGPGADQTIVATIPPIADSVVSLGSTRSLPAWWTRVEYDGSTGWVNLAYLAYQGATDDITAAVKDGLGDDVEASSMTELGAMVAGFQASDDPPSDIVIVVEESLGDLGEVTYDVVGLGDDAVRGTRVHVFGEPTDGGFRLRTVESTALCQPNRGVDDDGNCV